MLHRRAFVYTLFSMAAFAVGAAVVSLWSPLGSGDVPVLEIRRERFVHKVSADGTLKAAKSTPLSVPVSIQIPLKIAWMIEDGSPVEAGDLVIRFDSTELEKTLLDGKAALDTADSKIAKTKAEADAKLRNLNRDAGVAKLQLESARKFQSKDEEIFSRNEIIESEIDEKLAAHKLEHFEGAKETQKALSQIDESLLFIERRKANLKIQQAEESLSSLEIRAPHEGIVVFPRDWRGNLPQVGDMTWRGQPLAEIPVLDEMEAEVQVLEADAGGLVVGRPALVVLEAHPDEPINAQIRRVDNVPRPRTRGIPVQYFGVTLELEETDPAVMKPGLRVHATLLLEERLDAIAIPLQAVFEKEAKKVVYRNRTGRFDPVEVVLGPSSFGRVVVETGLEEGDVIALRDPTRTLGDTLLAGRTGTPAATPTPRRESFR